MIEARLETALGRGEGDRGVGGGLQDHQGPERKEDKQGEGTHQTVKEGLDNRKDVTEKVEKRQAGPRLQDEEGDEEGDEGERGYGEGEEEEVVTNNRRMKKRVRVIEEENKEEEVGKVERVGRSGEGDNLRLRLTTALLLNELV